MRSLMTLGVGLAGVLALGMGCGGSGSAGPAGQAGTNGTNGTNGTAGQNGTNGTNGNTSPSISAMIPRVGVLDREFDAIIVGNETVFDSTTQVDLGTGVTVSKLQVASPTALFAHVKVDKTATTGAHDLKVTGASAATVTGMFQVIPAIGVAITGGSQAQGGVAQVDITDNDTIGFAVNGAGNTTFQLLGNVQTLNTIYSSPESARFVIAFDPLAPPGADQANGLNSYSSFTSGNQQFEPLQTFYGAPNAFTVTAATPTTIPVGGADLAGLSLASQYDSGLFELTTDGTAQIVEVDFQGAPNTPIRPYAWAIPTSGTFSNYLYNAQGNSQTASPQPAQLFLPSEAIATNFYFVMMDGLFQGGPSGYGYSVHNVKYPATPEAETTSAHATEATAQSMTLGSPQLFSGNIGTASEIDIYTLPLAPNVSIRFTLTTQSDLCVAFDPGQGQIDQIVQGIEQAGYCYYTSLGTGFTHGFSTNLSYCGSTCGEPQAYAIAVFPRPGAANPTGKYVIGYAY